MRRGSRLSYSPWDFLPAAYCCLCCGRVLPQDGHQLVVKLRLAFRSYRTHWRALLIAILLSLLIHLIPSLDTRGDGTRARFKRAVFFRPHRLSAGRDLSAIPISLNGLGLREGGYIFLLAVIGISSEKGIAFGILLF